MVDFHKIGLNVSGWG